MHYPILHTILSSSFKHQFSSLEQIWINFEGSNVEKPSLKKPSPRGFGHPIRGMAEDGDLPGMSW